MSPRARWDREQSREWFAQLPWLVGCNYVPSSASNQLEMWQAETFDEAINDRELGWAAALGFNTVRVYLHDLLWAESRGFLDRIDRFLAIADRHRIRALFVLFDGVWDPNPRPGRQPEPVPGVHNSRWVQSPGAAILRDPSRHDDLRPYITGVIGHFRDDARVLGWDLFNEPDNPNPAYVKDEIPDKAEMALLLLRKTYEWARNAGPTQPLTSGLWRPQWVQTGELSDIDSLQLGESDVSSFHCYTGPGRLTDRLEDLEAHGRPVLLTEYLARPFGSTFLDILPVLKERRVAAYNWGLVSGRTQTIHGWDTWVKPGGDEPDPWFHDILRPDGASFDLREAAFLREIITP